MTKPDTTPEERARNRLNEFTGLMWHIATFVIVNGFLWIIVPRAALWVTIMWGIGLAFHIAAYFLDQSGFQSRRYERFLAEEKERDAQ
ncbi:MAG: 2TM domain-containing protein [Acidimicrobiia bacterium]|nr:2TM domain-containing protein [Acidimicrobiia bacterium]MDX2468019.1 2TM domain-containing protein [Acidimicrobiia bacterium]